MRSKFCALIVGLFSLLCSPLSAGHLKVNLAPAQAVSAGAQWRVDGGSWKNSGATVKNLSNTNHQVTFRTITGWITPAPVTVAITGNNTTTLNVTYLQAASLRVVLTPSSGQWRVDAGAWRASGATATGLTPGSHQVEYAGLSGYATPAGENVSLTGGQTTALNRTYTQLAQLSVTLSPSSGQWSLDGGAWQASGATVADLAPGAHTLSYASLANYASPATESVSLTPGQSLALTRSYVQLAQVSINLLPATGQWRADGGAWQPAGAALPVLPGDHFIEYAPLADYDPPQNEIITLAAGGSFTATRTYTSQKPSLQINLTPNTGQWRIDGGAWQANGAVVGELNAGTHTVDYSDIGGTYNPLPSETVSLALRENAVLARSYPVKPLASVHVTFNPAWTTAQWRIDGGAWLDASTTVYNLAYDAPHTVEFAPIDGYVAPQPETFTLTSGESRAITANYLPLAFIGISITPDWLPRQWRINGGEWLTTNTVSHLPFGIPHTVEFAAIEGYVTPPPQTVTLASGEFRMVEATYLQLASVGVSISPSWLQPQWRVNGGEWLNTFSGVNNLPFGVPHTVEFAPLEGYVTPPPQTVTLVSGESRLVEATYLQLASVGVSISPSWLQPQWRVNGGEWLNTFSGVNNLPFGVPHTVEFAPLEGYVTPPPQTVTLVSGESRLVEATYLQLASVGVSISPSWLQPQWRVNGGEWLNTFSGVNNLPFGVPHTVEFAPVEGYVTPPPQTVTLASGESRLVEATYLQLASVGVSISPSWLQPQWRVNGGEWLNTFSGVNNLPFGVPHTVEFAPVEGYVTPPPQTVTLASGESRLVEATYSPIQSGLTVTLTPAAAQWRIDGGAWQASGTTMTGLASGSHVLEFSSLAGYRQLPPESIYTSDTTPVTVSRTYPIWTPAEYTAVDVGTLGSGQTFTYGLNEFGTVTGTSWVGSSGIPHAFLSTNGVISDLEAAGGTQTVPAALNDANTVVGFGSYGGVRAVQISGSTVLNLGTFGGNFSHATGINQAGIVIGAATAADGKKHAFVRPLDTLLDLGTLGGTESQATAINNSDEIVGTFRAADSSVHGFRYTNGTMQDLGTFGGTSVHRIGLSESGTIYGSVFTGGGLRSFIWNNGVTTDLGTLGGDNTAAFAINASDVIVGGSDFADGQRRAFYYSGGSLHALPSLGTENSSQAWAINDAGTIIGWSLPSTGDSRAVVYRGGAIADLNAVVDLPETLLSRPKAINQVGQILVEGTKASSGLNHAYVLTPISGPGGLHVSLNQPGAQWRVDGGEWQANGAKLFTLAAGSHTIEYGSVSGYTAPATETVTISSGRLLQLNRSYAGL